MGPWPGTGKWHYHSVYRQVKTIPSIRDYVGMKADGLGDLVRGKRGKGFLPTSWDDIPRSRNHDTSWKACTKKRKQWER